MDPKKVIINIGATPDGIGAAYDIAKKMGFETTGIVSSQAKSYKDSITPAVDKVYFIEDATWGGMGPDGKLNPTSLAMVNASSKVIAIGGGDVGRDEIKAALDKKIPVTFIGTDMNKDVAIKKAAKKGQPVPTEFRGSAELEMLKTQKFERIVPPLKKPETNSKEKPAEKGSGKS